MLRKNIFLFFSLILTLSFIGCNDESKQSQVNSTNSNTRVTQSVEKTQVAISSDFYSLSRALRKKYLTEKRFALVIGNNDYLNFQNLENAINDSTGVGNSCKKLGFNVFFLENSDRKMMLTQIANFSNLLK